MEMASEFAVNVDTQKSFILLNLATRKISIMIQKRVKSVRELLKFTTLVIGS